MNTYEEYRSVSYMLRNTCLNPLNCVPISKYMAQFKHHKNKSLKCFVKSLMILNIKYEFDISAESRVLFNSLKHKKINSYWYLNLRIVHKKLSANGLLLMKRNSSISNWCYSAIAVLGYMLFVCMDQIFHYYRVWFVDSQDNSVRNDVNTKGKARLSFTKNRWNFNKASTWTGPTMKWTFCMAGSQQKGWGRVNM